MYYIIDKCILFLYCFLSLAFVPADYRFVIACLSACTVCNLNLAFPHWQVRWYSTLTYTALTLFLPEYCLFLPLVFYDLAVHDRFSGHCQPSSRTGGSKNSFSLFPEMFPCILSIAGGYSALFLYHAFPQPVLFFLIWGCLISALLHFRTASYENLLQKYRQTRDDDVEIQRLLEERNQSLLEKQDAEIYTATLKERNRIAREIHDHVGHMLTRSILMVGALRAIHREPEMAQSLEQLNDTLNQAMNNIRQSVHDLHDSSVNLREALETLIRDFTFCPVTLQYEMSLDIPREIKYSFISIAKEALVNITRHSSATAASIRALEHPGFYQFIIENNGNGTEKPSSFSQDDIIQSQGMGLDNIRSRVKTLNGNIQIQSKQGFRIYITVPKKSEQT